MAEIVYGVLGFLMLTGLLYAVFGRLWVLWLLDIGHRLTCPHCRRENKRD